MVKCFNLAPKRLPWTVPQVHAVLAEPQFLNAFHAESVTAHSMHVEPWVPPVFTSASGFTKARRVAYTMHCDGPGGAGLKAVTELQEMMYNTESGCLVFEATAFLSQDNARQLCAWHTELICAPAEGGGSTVKAAVSTSAGLLGGYQAGQCQAQLEGLLLCLGIKQAERFLPFAAEYASCLAYIKQLLSPEEAVGAMLGSTSRLAATGLSPSAPDQPAGHVTAHIVSAAHEPPVFVVATPLETPAKGAACTAAEQPQAASTSLQQLPPQHSLGGLQLSSKATSPELLLSPPEKGITTADNVLDQERAPQEVQAGERRSFAGLPEHDHKLHGANMFAPSSEKQDPPAPAAAAVLAQASRMPAPSGKVLSERQQNCAQQPVQRDGQEGQHDTRAETDSQPSQSDVCRTLAPPAGGQGTAGTGTPLLWVGKPLLKAGVLNEEAASTQERAEGATHGKGADWVGGRGWCQAEGSFLDSFNTVASSKWRPPRQDVPHHPTSGMQPSLPALDISPVKPQDLTQQEHAAESSQPKQVWGRGGDMLHVDSQRTSGVSTERLDDQHVQPTTDDLAAVADATAFPGEAPAAQTSMLARQPEHGNVKGGMRRVLLQLWRALRCKPKDRWWRPAQG